MNFFLLDERDAHWSIRLIRLRKDLHKNEFQWTRDSKVHQNDKDEAGTPPVPNQIQRENQ